MALTLLELAEYEDLASLGFTDYEAAFLTNVLDRMRRNLWISKEQDARLMRLYNRLLRNEKETELVGAGNE